MAGWKVTTELAGAIHENLRNMSLLNIFPTVRGTSSAVSPALNYLDNVLCIHFFLTLDLCLQAYDRKQSEKLEVVLPEFNADL